MKSTVEKRNGRKNGSEIEQVVREVCHALEQAFDPFVIFTHNRQSEYSEDRGLPWLTQIPVSG